MSDTPANDRDQLGAAAALAEQGFLVAGEKLEQAVGILDHLAARFTAYTAEFTGEALAETRGTLAVAGSHLAALADARQADAASIAALGETVAATGQRVEALQPITHEVETLSLSARVVAGGMGLVAADFGAFADGIQDAARHARDCLAAAHEALRHVGQQVTTAQVEADAFTLKHGSAMAAIPRRLAANLASLTAQQRRAAEAISAAQRESETIRQQVAAQIVALQLGDMIRQRLEHVQSATLLAAPETGLPGDLLAGQLNDAADDLDRDGATVEAGLNHLVAAAQAIGRLGSALHGETAGGFVTALEADIRQTAALFGELGAGDAANDQRMAAVLGAAGTLTGRLTEVQSVQEDLRIMGLNATLKCRRLGVAGRALAAVAQELRFCGRRFETHAGCVLQELGQLRAVAEALCNPARRSRHAELAQATEAMLLPLQRLNGLEQDLRALLAQLHGDAAAVGRLVQDALGQFVVRHALAATLRETAGSFAAWPPASACPAEVLDRIAAGYTMAREREVHARYAPLRQAVEEIDVFF